MHARLSILVCTIDERIARVADMLLPQRDDTVYVVAWQCTSSGTRPNVPACLTARPDVRVVVSHEKGLSRNRNIALAACQTELAVIADDDLRYTNACINNVIRTFDTNPQVDIALFQALTPEGKLLKKYAEVSFDYASPPRFAFYASCEIALRNYPGHLPEFNILFGLGAPVLTCGEEEVFLYEAHRAGFTIRYFPHPLCTLLNTTTTGTLFDRKAGVRRAKGGVLFVIHGAWSALPRIFFFAFIHKRRGALVALRDMLSGYTYARKHYNRKALALPSRAKQS